MKAKCIPLQELISPQLNIVESLTSQSFFASQGFIKLWTSMSGTPVYWVLEDNDEIVALLPAVEFGVGKLKRLQALPDGCYSTVFTTNSSQSSKYKKALLQAILSFGYQKLYIYDYSSSISEADKYDALHCQTTLVDVSSSDWQPPDKKLQSEIRKADRENVEIESFNIEKHFDKFIELMSATEKRHNRKPKYTKPFFLALAELAQIDTRIIWNFCEHEGNAVSSHINFIEHNQIINWQVYFDKDYSFLKANQKMLVDLAQVARDKDIQYLNLGSNPIETPTLSEYKNKWGGVTKEYYCYYKKTLLGKIF